MVVILKIVSWLSNVLGKEGFKWLSFMGCTVLNDNTIVNDKKNL
jgi:hypothetical protein